MGAIQPGRGSGDSIRTTDRIRVKFVAKGHFLKHAGIFLRQFPGRSGRWGRCDFTFDPEDTNYDWLAVYDDLPPHPGERFSTRIESLRCAPQHTLFITMEPSSIKTYGFDFLDQFGLILTSQEPWAITNPQTVYSQPALRWFYGEAPTRIRCWDEMVQTPPDEKTRDLSAVCSAKRQKNTEHAARYDFTMRLKDAVPTMSVYGRGVCPIDDKADALDTFRYHITIENHIGRHHWTEKLADAFLGLTLPFYHGCPNAAEYFPPESFIPINIHNPDAAIDTIRNAIRSQEFERRLPAIREARRRVLEEYNLFSVIARHVEQRFDRAAPLDASARLYSRHTSRRRSMLHTLRFGAEHLTRKLRLRRNRRAA